MKKLIRTILLLAALVTTLVITCPTTNDHKETLTQEISNAWKSEHIGNSDNLLGALGGLLSDNVVKLFVNTYLIVEDYKVVSIGTLYYDGEQHIATIGLLNHVWCLVEDNDLMDAIEE